MSPFFIKHPIIAGVISIVTTMLGIICLLALPISQYPEVASPSIQIRTRYAGASPTTVDQTVTQVIEQNMTGIDNMIYMRSKSDSSGTCNITLTFEVGTDPDVAHMQVQNKVQQVQSQLPAAVQAQVQHYVPDRAVFPGNLPVGFDDACDGVARHVLQVRGVIVRIREGETVQRYEGRVADLGIVRHNVSQGLTAIWQQ